MKNTSIFVGIGSLLLVIMLVAGCGGGGGGPTGPANPPVLGNYNVNPNPANSGATIVLTIDYVDPSGTMNEGISYIADSQGNTYAGTISNAPGTTGALITSFVLSPLVTPGELLLYVWVQNTAGFSSNTITIPLTVV